MTDLQTDIPIPPQALKAIQQAIEAALTHQGQPPDAALSLRITDDAALQALNRDYLGIDAPTDVLSFPAGETDPESGRPYLGDIAISYPCARRQAERGGHAVEHELQLLAVHGVLHLLGHDHAAAQDKARMWQAQAEILAAIGCPLSPP